MATWLPSVPYPPPRDGFWSPVTSTLNWCEEDYYATVYLAEFVNSLTNLSFLYLGGKGLINCWKHGHERIFSVAFLGYFFVGLGSFLFHGTLKYPMQLLDELSMIYTTCIMSYASFSYGRSRTYCFCVAIAYLAISIFITGYYHYIQNPDFHQNAYAILTSIVLGHSTYLMEKSLRPSLRSTTNGKGVKEPVTTNGTPAQKRMPYAAKGKASKPANVADRERKQLDERDKRTLLNMWILIVYGFGISMLGFVIWSFDNKHCSELRRWRHKLGLPWGMLLEGHGWWHLMTGAGGYACIVWGIWLRHIMNGKQDDYELYWPRFIGSVPVLVRKASSNTQAGSTNSFSVKRGKKKR